MPADQEAGFGPGSRFVDMPVQNLDDALHEHAMALLGWGHLYYLSVEKLLYPIDFGQQFEFLDREGAGGR
jgi:hypothetical protein